MSGNRTAPTDDAIAFLPGMGGVSQTIFFRDVSVPRWPVAALKDPRLRLPETPSAAAHWTDALAILPREAAADFLAMAKVLCPHDWLDERVYCSVITAMDRDAGFARLLIEDYATVAAGFSKAPASLSADVLTRELEKIENTPFFRNLLSRTILHLYDHPEVWSGCGYEGVAGCSGDQPREDIADADWLPDPQAPHGESR